MSPLVEVSYTEVIERLKDRAQYLRRALAASDRLGHPRVGTHRDLLATEAALLMIRRCAREHQPKTPTP